MTEFLLNELSVHGQFSTIQEFTSSVDVVMEIRNAIRKSGRELHCSRDLTSRYVMPTVVMQQAVQVMPREKGLAWIQWLSRVGPHWSDDQQHGLDEWLELDSGVDASGTAIGEAAFRCLNHSISDLVSMYPSDWNRDKLPVTWLKNSDQPVCVDIKNHWKLSTVVESLGDLPDMFDSWSTLEGCVRRVCSNLTFADYAFEAFRGHPYVHGAANGILRRLRILDQMCDCFDKDGRRTTEGDQLYSDHFVGDKAWFTDSSDSEKVDFKDDLCFPHPDRPGKYLSCTWHGKVKTPQLRIHFTWPIVPRRPVYVVYVGPKITKR